MDGDEQGDIVVHRAREGPAPVLDEQQGGEVDPQLGSFGVELSQVPHSRAHGGFVSAHCCF